MKRLFEFVVKLVINEAEIQKYFSASFIFTVHN